MWHALRGVSLVAMLACAIAGAPAGAAPYIFTLIAQTGGTPGSSFGTLDHAPSLNNSGTVAFSAGIHTTGTVGIWTGSGGALTSVISNDSNTFIGGPAVINNAGQVGFQGNIGTDGGFWLNTGGLAGSNTNLFNSPSFGAIQGQPAINDSGVGAAYVQPGGFTTEGIYTSTGAPVAVHSQPISTGLHHSPDINNSGNVAFTNVDGNGNRGIFMWNGASVVQLVDVTTNGLGLQTGSSADIQTPRINDNDTVVFHGRLTTGESGIFVEASGTVSQVALAGISGGEYGSFDLTAAINNSDEVAFLATVISGGDGIFTGGDPVNDKVIQVGDALFGSTVVGIDFSSFGLNDSGQIAFWATLADGRAVVARADLFAEQAPEPATLTLLGLGLLGLAAARRRTS